MEYEELRSSFELLNRLVNPNGFNSEKADLTNVEKIIFKQLPETLESNAPANFPELYFN